MTFETHTCLANDLTMSEILPVQPVPDVSLPCIVQKNNPHLKCPKLTVIYQHLWVLNCNHSAPSCPLSMCDGREKENYIQSSNTYPK